MPKPQARKPRPDHAPLAAVPEQLVAPACAHEQRPLAADPSGFSNRSRRTATRRRR